jgi:hypothetical protein
VLETVLDKDTPPQRFSVSTSGGVVLTIDSKIQFGTDKFYLADSKLAAETAPTELHFVPLSGKGFIHIAPEPRQSLFHVYKPGEVVPVEAFFNGEASRAQIALDFEAEEVAGFRNNQRRSILFSSGGISREGNATWTVPLIKGPGRLRMTLSVGRGEVVYSRLLRIAITAPIDLSAVNDSPFGVHLSTAGYPLLGDEFVSLLGAKMGRVTVRWSQVEISDGQYDFSRIDPLIAFYEAQNMKVVALLGEDVPSWLKLGDPSTLGPWRRFVAAAVQRYRNRVRYLASSTRMVISHY